MKKLPLDTSIKEIDIYVIFSTTSKEFFVGKNKSASCYQTYKNHAAKRNKQTKDLFERAEKTKDYPQMYLLETLQTNEETAFRHRIAWTKYFVERGFQCIDTETIRGYAEDLLDETKKIFETIKSVPMDNALHQDRLIVSKYKKLKGQKKNGTRATITIYLSRRDYEKIQKKADCVDLNLSRYCKNMVLDGRIVTLESPHLWEYTAELREANSILKQILNAIYQNGRYYPADLENIQKMVDKIIQADLDVSESFRKYAGEVLKVLPK